MYYTNDKTILLVLLSLLLIFSIQATSYANTAPVFSDGDSTERSVRENTDSDKNIGDAVSATDADEDTLTYSLGGTDASDFQIDSETGQLQTKSSLNFENESSYSVTITVSDGNDGSDTIDVTIQVIDVLDLSTPLRNRHGRIRDAIVSAVDGIDNANDIGDSHLLQITELNLKDKNIRRLRKSDFGGLTNLKRLILDSNPLGRNYPSDVFDKVKKLEYLSMINCSMLRPHSGIFDKLSNLEELKLNGNRMGNLSSDLFDDLSSLKSISLKSMNMSSVSADLFEGLSNLETIDISNNRLVELPEGIFEGLTSLQTVSLRGNLNTLECTTSLEKVTDNTVKATIHTAAPFDLELDLSVNKHGKIKDNLDSITISKGELESDAFTVERKANTYKKITVTIPSTEISLPSGHNGYGIGMSRDLPLEVISEISREPVFTEGSSTTRSVQENTASGVNIGDPVSATSYHSGFTLTYTLGGTDADSFDINSGSGQLKTKAALDYETEDSYSVKVTVTDDDDISSTIDVTINVTNVDELPQFSEDSPTRSVDENKAAGTSLGDPISATDPEGKSLTYTVTPTTHFRIDSDTGELTTKKRLDYETKSSYSITVRVSDNRGRNRNSIDVTINVNDLFEATPLSDRTSEVSDAIVAALSDVDDADDVTDTDLASITTLGLSDSDIDSLQNGDFDGLSALKILYLDDNSLTTLPNDVFDGLSNLEELDLSDNSISTLNRVVFSELVKLVKLDISDNSISSLPASVFHRVTKLVELDLSGNSLSTLPQAVFNKVTELVKLNLSDNSISSLPSKVFEKVEKLEELDLSDNSLSSLHSALFSWLSDLKKLDLSDNSLSRLQNNIFSGLESLNALLVDGNRVDPLKIRVKLVASKGGYSNVTGVRAQVLTGTPYSTLAVRARVTNGVGYFEGDSFSSEGETFSIFYEETGTVSSPHIRVLRISGTTDPVTVELIGLGSFHPPSEHKGYEFEFDATEVEVYPEVEASEAPANNEEQIPDVTEFLPNYPNPFNPETWIPYQLSTPADVTLTIYNMRGVVVRKLALGHQPAGYYTSRSRAAYWDGRNEFAEKVATGIYFCVFKAGDFSATQKMLILK